MNHSKRSSVRWRIVLIYVVLVFIAMTIASVFLLESIEQYQLGSLKQNIVGTVSKSNLLDSLSQYDSLLGHQKEIQESFDESWQSGFSEELSVIDGNFTVCASTNKSLVGKDSLKLFDRAILLESFMKGVPGESDSESAGIPMKNYSFGISNKAGTITGVVYVRADLSDINGFISQSRKMFVRAIAMALVITVILSFVLARSITVPINKLTENVVGMSQGDFSTPVMVKSDDEIGQLAAMFNLMREKLDSTLSEIQNEKNKLETILQYMADGLIAIDLSGGIIHANPAARAMLGVPQDEDISKLGYQRVLGGISPKMALDAIKENCREKGCSDTIEYGPSIFAVRYDRFKDPSGQDIGIIIIMQDITERQKLEDMQTDFVANVSHELKTPLTNIKSYTETLLDGAIDDKPMAVRFLGIIDSEADRMNRLVKDLLQLSRMDNGKSALSLKETNIVSIVDAAVTKVEMTAKQKSQQMNRLYDQELDVRCSVDRDSFEQVVLNVLTNAIKYTEQGGRIDVDVFVRGGSARISVKDTGIGIPAASLPRIFDRFYRVDKARSRAMGGTGLGLAITKQIVEEHGGTIEAESREGEGTKITITLPLAVRRGVRNIE